MKERKTKQLITMVVVLAMLMTMTTVVFAADSAVTGAPEVTIDALAITNFDAVTLTGITITTSAVVTDTIITDATGTGNGWNVSLSATQFYATTDASIKASADQLKLPLGSLKLGTVSISTTDLGTTTSGISTSKEFDAIDNGC